MGQYCACGVKKVEGWICECIWDGWYLCWEQSDKELHSIPVKVPIKEIPDKEGIYQVRVFEDGDDYEDKSAFSVIEKNWGEDTNTIVSHWEIEYYDGWTGYRHIYAWRENE